VCEHDAVRVKCPTCCAPCRHGVKTWSCPDCGVGDRRTLAFNVHRPVPCTRCGSKDPARRQCQLCKGLIRNARGRIISAEKLARLVK
jgi:hypothetical protein